jgi:hypothetical protein
MDGGTADAVPRPSFRAHVSLAFLPHEQRVRTNTGVTTPFVLGTREARG